MDRFERNVKKEEEWDSVEEGVDAVGVWVVDNRDIPMDPLDDGPRYRASRNYWYESCAHVSACTPRLSSRVNIGLWQRGNSWNGRYER